jgi:hypothetical protein
VVVGSGIILLPLASTSRLLNAGLTRAGFAPDGR